MPTLPIAESDVTGLVADLALKAPLASPTLTNTPAAPTAAQNTNTTQLATTAMVHSEAVLLAPLASPTFTGTVTVPNGSGATDIAAFGQVPAAGAVGGLVKVVFRTADSSTITSTTVLAADDTLKWAVGANDQWLVQGYFTFTAANSTGTATTADLKVSYTVPASGTMSYGAYGVTSNTYPGFGLATTANSPLALKVAPATTGIGADAVAFGVSHAGIYQGGGTGGTVNLTWAQNTSSTSTLQINTNSLLLLWRLA